MESTPTGKVTKHRHYSTATSEPKPCTDCGETIDPRRVDLNKNGINTSRCIECQEDYEKLNPVRHCVVPMHKSNFVYVTPTAQGREIIKGINNKGGLVK
jgi:hypothetical protein